MTKAQLRQLNMLRDMIEANPRRNQLEMALDMNRFKCIGLGSTRSVWGRRGWQFVVKVNKVDTPLPIGQWGGRVTRQPYLEYLFYQMLRRAQNKRRFFAKIFYYDDATGHSIMEFVPEVRKPRKECPLCGMAPDWEAYLGTYDILGVGDRNHGHRPNGEPIIVDYGMNLKQAEGRL